MIQNLIGVEIPLFSELEDSEIEKRIEQEEAASLGMDCFIQGKISFEDYLDILELCEVDMDAYSENVNSNLIILGM
jgi:hypothetical protein